MCPGQSLGSLGSSAGLAMNHVEERLSLLHFWTWERNSILLNHANCCNVFINWVFGVLKFNGSQWLCPASKVQSLLFWLGTCFEGNYQGSVLGPLLFLIYVNDMLLQIQNGSHLSDDICLICYGNDHTQIKDFLSIQWWIAISNVQVNVNKSHVMWFLVKSSKPPTTRGAAASIGSHQPPLLLPILLEVLL